MTITVTITITITWEMDKYRAGNAQGEYVAAQSPSSQKSQLYKPSMTCTSE